MPDSMGALVVGLSAPAAPVRATGAPRQGGLAILVAGWGDEAAHAAAVEPLRGRGALFELVTPIPYVALQQLIDEANPWGIRPTTRASTSTTSATRRSRSSSTGCAEGGRADVAPIFPLRGRYREIPDDATAFGSSRSARWAVSMVAMGLPEEGDEGFAAARAWARGFWQAMRPFAPNGATYVNFETDADEARVRDSYGEAKHRRLAELKAVWDPDNVFHHNANIRPAAAADIPQPRATSEAPVAQRSEPRV